MRVRPLDFVFAVFKLSSERPTTKKSLSAARRRRRHRHGFALSLRGDAILPVDRREGRRVQLRF